jgi:Domain of unknown function (DUF4157)
MRRLHAVAFAFLMCAKLAYASAHTIAGVDVHSGEDPQKEPVDAGTIPEITEDLPPDVRETLLDRAALALATAIRESRRQALDRGTDSIPPRIRAELEPYFPAKVLDKARWTMAGGISLDGMLTSWFALEGAVTLGEVIAFSGNVQVSEDVELWAHELTHVMQYEQLGIDTFALEYLRDFSAMESEASGNASRIMADVAAAE